MSQAETDPITLSDKIKDLRDAAQIQFHVAVLGCILATLPFIPDTRSELLALVQNPELFTKVGKVLSVLAAIGCNHCSSKADRLEDSLNTDYSK